MALMLEVEVSGCCRVCPVREEHYSLVSDKIRCRVCGEWNEFPDVLPAWCPALEGKCWECTVDKTGLY